MTSAAGQLVEETEELLESVMNTLKGEADLKTWGACEADLDLALSNLGQLARTMDRLEDATCELEFHLDDAIGALERRRG